MPRITIDISEKEAEDIKKRGKENYLTTKEQIEEIIRRSMISWKSHRKNKRRPIKVDDKLVGIFSRANTGPKKK